MCLPAFPSHRPAGRALAAVLLLCLAGLLPAGPVAAAIVNYNIANPTANGWTGGTIAIGSLDDTLPTLPSLITAIIGGATKSFVPNFHSPWNNDLFISAIPPAPNSFFELGSNDFGTMTSTPTTTWRDIITTNGGTYANNRSSFYFDDSSSWSMYSTGLPNGTSVTFSEEIPVPAPFALLLAAVPALWLQRRRARVGHPV